MMMKCKNCGAENPDDAKYCRQCGREMIDSSIKWIDISLVKVNPSAGYVFLDIILFIAFGVFVACFIACTEHYLNYHEDWDNSMYFLLITSFILFFILCYMLTYKKRKTSEIRNVASAIENSDRNDRYLTKAGKYGLYDWRRKKVLLPVEYDSLTPLNIGAYYIIVIGNKQGIYSRLSNSIIVPCEYDAVTPFVDSVATLTKGNITKRVDTQGNIF
jgi:RNA polymerase subunit RPABC4/transcription elongation factor Spt4